MRILVVSQHYWPEPLDSTQICEGLVERGHEVCVLCGEPNYPEGTIYPGYDARELRREERNGVQIVRVPLHPRKTGPVHRVWNYYSFAASATKVAAELPGDFDVVLSYQTSPVMMARPALAYAKRTGVPLLLYCLDIWPECLLAGGIKRGGIVYNHYRKVAHDIYQAADRVAVSSPFFVGYLREEVGVRLSNPVDLPHFASDALVDVCAEPRADYDRAKVNLTFAGNVGAAQSVETIVRAAALCVDDERLAFHVVGSGTELDSCRQLARTLGASNVIFHGRFPQEAMPAFYAASDAMLLTLAGGTLLGLTLPLKLHTYLAASKPVLGAVTGDAERVIREAGCGRCVPAEDAEGLARICRDFAERDDWAELGSRARDYYDANYTKERFFERLEEALDDLRGTKHGS